MISHVMRAAIVMTPGYPGQTASFTQIAGQHGETRVFFVNPFHPDALGRLGLLGKDG
jgi:hypothetical protein